MLRGLGLSYGSQSLEAKQGLEGVVDGGRAGATYAMRHGVDSLAYAMQLSPGPAAWGSLDIGFAQ